MSIAVHTVCILRENIMFLEEWVNYHINVMKFDFIYLYDNTGSKEEYHGNMTVTGKNKYGIPIMEITENLSDSDIDQMLSKIVKQYPVKVIQWQPLRNGAIEYGYTKSCIDCIDTFKHEVEWIAFIDIDEFIVSDRNSNSPRTIKDFMKIWNSESATSVVMGQSKFTDRFIHFQETGQPSVKSILTKTLMKNNYWSHKNIIKIKHFIKEKAYNFAQNVPITGTHGLNNCLDVSRNIGYNVDILGFNHYNCNPRGIKWMLDHGVIELPVKTEDDSVLANRLTPPVKKTEDTQNNPVKIKKRFVWNRTAFRSLYYA